MTRNTHTYSRLNVSRAAYTEIAKLLKDADYQHAFIEKNDGTVDINMHGIGLAIAPGEPSSHEAVGMNSDQQALLVDYFTRMLQKAGIVDPNASGLSGPELCLMAEDFLSDKFIFKKPFCIVMHWPIDTEIADVADSVRMHNNILGVPVVNVPQGVQVTAMGDYSGSISVGGTTVAASFQTKDELYEWLGQNESDATLDEPPSTGTIVIPVNDIEEMEQTEGITVLRRHPAGHTDIQITFDIMITEKALAQIDGKWGRWVWSVQKQQG